MPYLQRPRLHFAGRFTADVSTYNNTDSNFPITGFDPNANPLWNPTGSGDFSISATVTSVCYDDGTNATTARQDAIVGMSVSGMAPGGVAGKLVDLDPDQQGVSQIWCLQISVGGAISGAFVTAAFTDMWRRMPGNPSGMEGAGAFYQSQLASPAWSDPGASKFFTQLRAAAGDQPLSIRFSVDAMIADSSNPLFRTGRVVGTIGAAQAGEPQHVTRGRQMFALSSGFGNGVAFVDRTAGKVVVDLGNLLPVSGSGGGFPGPLADNGEISIGTAAQPDMLGTLPSSTYTAAGWYEQTAGIVDLPADRKLSDAELATLGGTALQVSTAAGAIAQEQNGGQWVRADNFFYRLNPGDAAEITLYATSFGEPLAGASIACALDPNTLNSTPASALPALAQQPVVVVTDANGMATLSLTAADPGRPRASDDIDGQVYAVRPVLQLPGGATPTVNYWDFVSILIFSGYQIPPQPTWWKDAQPILQQFANLYPVMKQQGIIDLGDYASVASMAPAVISVLSLPETDPGFMPVTRDLSRAKTQMLLQWLATTGGPNGGPNEGTQPSRVAEAFAVTAHAAKSLVAHARAAVTPHAPHRDHEHYASSVAYRYDEKPHEYDAKKNPNKDGPGEEPAGKE